MSENFIGKVSGFERGIVASWGCSKQDFVLYWTIEKRSDSCHGGFPVYGRVVLWRLAHHFCLYLAELVTQSAQDWDELICCGHASKHFTALDFLRSSSATFRLEDTCGAKEKEECGPPRPLKLLFWWLYWRLLYAGLWFMDDFESCWAAWLPVVQKKNVWKVVIWLWCDSRCNTTLRKTD